MRTMSTALGAVALTIAGLAASVALAHHGFGGQYDRSAPIYLEGVVAEAYFGFPHAEVVIDADPEIATAPEEIMSGEFAAGLTFWREELGQRLEVEFPPVTDFFELGGRVSAGDRIGLVVLRNCEAPHQLRAQWITPNEGAPVLRTGRMQSETPGC